MVRLSQLGIVLGVLGVVLAFMGLFPGVTGLTPTPGMGLIQVLTILTGFSLLIIGAFIFAKYAIYTYTSSNLAQQIGMRLALTGLLFAGMTALADVLGFGSNVPPVNTEPFFGPWQAIGLVGGFLLAAIGVLIYALTGPQQ